MYLGGIAKQSRTIGLELARERTRAEVPCIFYLHNLFSAFIYLLAYKKSENSKLPKILIPLSYVS